MSKMVWSKLMVPSVDVARTVLKDEVYKDIVEDVKPHEWASNQIPIPDPKAFRSMTRASLMLTYVCYEAKEILAPYLAKSPFAVGVYCAVENGPIDAPSTARILSEEGQKLGFAEAYRKFRNPKMYLKQLPNLVPAQMGIFMGLQGPSNVYTHSMEGSIQALEQAEWDLQSGVVEAALVCTAHAFDDFLVVKRTRNFDKRTIVEGAAAIVLVKDSNSAKTDWVSKIKQDKESFYGISNPLINLLRP